MIRGRPVLGVTMQIQIFGRRELGKLIIVQNPMKSAIATIVAKL